MSRVEIEWLGDSYDCETCGYSYAEGARITIDGQVSLELVPRAHCFGGDNYSERDVFERILGQLGHEVVHHDAA